MAVWAASSSEIADKVEGAPWQEGVRSHDKMSAHPYPPSCQVAHARGCSLLSTTARSTGRASKLALIPIE